MCDRALGYLSTRSAVADAYGDEPSWLNNRCSEGLIIHQTGLDPTGPGLSATCAPVEGDGLAGHWRVGCCAFEPVALTGSGDRVSFGGEHPLGDRGRYHGGAELRPS
jgi:hypothetical protein